MLLNVTLRISISVVVIPLVVVKGKVEIIDESNLVLSVDSSVIVDVELDSFEENELLLVVSKVSDEIFIIEE